jgi:hypothetical protein
VAQLTLAAIVFMVNEDVSRISAFKHREEHRAVWHVLIKERLARL